MISLHWALPRMPARRVGAILAVLAILPTTVFGLRTYGSLVLLHSAYAVGAPATSTIRPWMTLGYVATTYGRSEAGLRAALGVPPAVPSDTSLMTLAGQVGVSRPVFVQRVQRAVAGSARIVPASQQQAGWFATMADEALSSLLLYGYPALGLILLAGALGLPVPDGVAILLAGSLIAAGRMTWLSAGAVATLASLFGDVAGYGVGRLLCGDRLDRYGRWIRYTPERRAVVAVLFRRYGILTVLLTRTLVSYLSTLASLLAGASRYGLAEFTGFALLGRLLWTTAYLGLGYAIGADFEAAAGFLANASGLLVSLAVFSVSLAVAARELRQTPTVAASHHPTT